MKYCIVPVTAYQQNCSLLICEQTGKAAIVDPGGEIELIRDAIVRHNVTPECILITHGHLDHVGGTAELAERLTLPVLGPHQADRFWLDAIPDQCRSFGFPASKSFTPSRWLTQGDIVTVGRERLEVLHCPGHTPGHIVFFNRVSKLAVVGDVLFKGSIGRTDLPNGDYQTLLDSIKNRLWPLGKEVAFIPGHGPMSTFGEEMKSNPFVRIK